MKCTVEGCNRPLYHKYNEETLVEETKDESGNLIGFERYTKRRRIIVDKEFCSVHHSIRKAENMIQELANHISEESRAEFLEIMS